MDPSNYDDNPLGCLGSIIYVLTGLRVTKFLLIVLAVLFIMLFYFGAIYSRSGGP